MMTFSRFVRSSFQLSPLVEVHWEGVCPNQYYVYTFPEEPFFPSTGRGQQNPRGHEGRQLLTVCLVLLLAVPSRKRKI